MQKIWRVTLYSVFVLALVVVCGCAQKLEREGKAHSDEQVAQKQPLEDGTSGSTPLHSVSVSESQLNEQIWSQLGQVGAKNFFPDLSWVIPQQVWAGEPFVISFSAADLQKVECQWIGKKLSAVPGHSGQKKGVAEIALSVPLKETSATLPLKVILQSKGRSVVFDLELVVDRRQYPEQRLKVAQKYVTPPPEVLERIAHDRKLFREAIRPVTSEKFWNVPFLRPVPGSVSSVYGLRRFFNGVERNPHRGIDFRAAAGDPIKVIEDGRVVLVEDQYYGGNTVVVDHGLGVYSAYLHLSEFLVEKGAFLRRGEPLGLIGSTGRSTGPHLHLSLIVLGESVDPAPFVAGMQRFGQ